ncbi:MAG: SH3 domain-containing protein [Anaerolineae bacterium]|nr:SH3 domain-containing protein [Anaerolineae bacterium]
MYRIVAKMRWLVAFWLIGLLTVVQAAGPLDESSTVRTGVEAVAAQVTSTPIPTTTPIPPPPVPLCADLNGQTNAVVRADVSTGSVPGGNIYCRVLAENGVILDNVRGARIGNPRVLALGVIHAVDVFALLSDGISKVEFEGTISVCLQGGGSLVYLDAAEAPRPPVILTNASSNSGYTCGSISQAGTLVLTTSGGDLPGASGVQTSYSGVPLSIAGCVVTPWLNLKLRAVPGLDGLVFDVVPEGLPLATSKRTRRWFQVNYNNHTGWISAGYVYTQGPCNY